MIAPYRKHHGHPESGFTLVELMVALLLSLFVLGGVIQLYLHNKQYYRFQEAAAQVQANGRFAIETLSYHLRLAGYRQTQPAEGALTNAIVPDDSVEGGGSDPDRIAIRYEAEQDCRGNTATPPQVFAFKFEIRANEGLFCNGEQIVGGVENMQILYGEDTNHDGVANRYLRRNDVDDLQNVVSLRIALLIASDDMASNTTDDQSYSLAGTVIPAANDRRIRSVYSTTISIRNGGI